MKKRILSNTTNRLLVGLIFAVEVTALLSNTAVAGNVSPQTTPVNATSPAASATSGLDFPGSAAVSTTMRFKFVDPHLNGLPIYGPGGNGVTYIWRAYPRQQSGYYTAFFWGNDDGQGNICTFRWVGNCDSVDTYYGAHPYPRYTNTSLHDWEISIEGSDIVNGQVVYDRWYTQALRVWSDGSGKHHEFYWDLPNTDDSHRVTVILSPTSWGNTNPPHPALTWGDAPWNPGNEVWNGILRGIQIYSSNLSVADILSEVATPLSTPAGASNIWYMNLNPTPNDISDKSGKGHHPSWVGNERPALYTEGTPTPPTEGAPTPPAAPRNLRIIF